MRKIKTFMDYLLTDTCVDSEHQRHNYNTIYGKIIYPVAISPLHLNEDYKHYHKPENYNRLFDNRSRYHITR